MRFTVAAFLAFIVLVAISCKDNSTTPKEENNPPKDTVIYFSGLTMTDDNGLAMNVPDASDWGFKDQWSNREAGLFSNTSGSICTVDSSYAIQVYPNPCKNVIAINVKKPADARFSFRLVDQQLKVLLTQDQLDANNLQINTSGVAVKDTLRMYYKITRGNCELRGHGDVLLQ